MPPLTRKTPQATRRRILDAAFAEIHASGFRAASVDNVMRAAGVTKGALYHHFRGKAALGHAVVSELLAERIRLFSARLESADDPLLALQEWCLSPPALPLRLGCPLNNLAQELASVDEPFRVRIEEVFRAWRASIAAALERGRARGLVRHDVEPERIAAFLLAALEGSVSLAKSAQDEQLFRSNMRMLESFLGTLRPAAEAQGNAEPERKRVR